jgi:formate hydrogenlyase transcriptional activator
VTRELNSASRIRKFGPSISENKVQEKGLTPEFVQFPDLTAGQYRNLLDLAQLVASHSTIDALFPTLSLRLQRALNFDVVTLGLYDASTESIHLNVWNADGAQTRCESLPVHTCASGWSWKNQRSVLVQDLDAEPKLPVFLESLRKNGVRTYYVLPLTTTRQKLGAIGFGSLRVIPKTKEMLEFLRRAAAIIAQVLDTTLSSERRMAPTACFQPPSVVTPQPEPEPRDFNLREEASREEAFQEIVGDSAPLREVLRQVRTVAATDATVLLLGETGTGKELVARALHRLSPRAGSNFITVNCTAIPTELLESELFGHEKGAFTGAINRHLGRLELADQGTLLLDEVGDLPTPIQPKLLRVLQDKQFERLGSNRTLRVDVRLIAATNHDLQQSIAEGRFRQDLFYRLNVFPIYLPPLRTRKSDIPALVRRFVSRYASEWKKPIEIIPEETMNALVNWNWPGNIRELQNFVQRCVILTDSPVLRVPTGELRGRASRPSGKMSEAAERELILQALKEASGVIAGASGAARRLGMKRTTLYSKMKKLNIAPHSGE